MNPRPLIATAAALGALAFAGSASAATFSQTVPIQPGDRVAGSPNPGVPAEYPSPLRVHGLTGSITHVRLSLKDVSSTFPDDLDVMLVAPDGHAVTVMSDVGASNDLSHATITIDDGAASSLPDSDGFGTGV